MIATNGKDGVTQKRSEQATAITAKGLRRLLEEQSYRCALTGRELTPDVATVDHKHPLSDGGTNTLDNVQIVHCDVNQAKGAMSQEAFLAMCREVVQVADAKEHE